MKEAALARKLGNRVAELRAVTGMTQDDLAQKSGLTVEAISRLERTEREPRLGTLGKIAAGLNVSLAQLLDLDKVGAPLAPLSRDLQVLLELLRGKPSTLVRKVTKISRVLLE